MFVEKVSQNILPDVSEASMISFFRELHMNYETWIGRDGRSWQERIEIIHDYGMIRTEAEIVKNVRNIVF